MEQYISKSALVAEIDRLKDELKAPDSAAYAEAYIIGAEHTIKTISDVIDTFEVKEMKEEPVSEDLAKNPELSGWVARDKDGNLHVFEVKPKRSIDDCRWWDRDCMCSAIDKNAFRDLKWEDEPVCVKLIIIKEE